MAQKTCDRYILSVSVIIVPDMIPRVADVAAMTDLRDETIIQKEEASSYRHHVLPLENAIRITGIASSTLPPLYLTTTTAVADTAED